MEALAQTSFLTVEEYLAGEEQSDIRHEYIGGVAYAMAGTTLNHISIVGSTYSSLRNALRSGPCQVYFTEAKVQITAGERQIFYYPDLVVSCEPQKGNDLFCRSPKLIIEVLSESTEATDRREKFWNYILIDSLEEYVLVAQSRVEIIVFRRAAEWKADIYRSMDDAVRLQSLGVVLPVRDIYEGVGF